MFDIGGWEFLFIVVIAIVVIGPKDLPGTIRTITGWIRRARELASEFQSGLDDIARESDLNAIKDDIQSGLGIDEITEAGNTIRNDIEQSIDPMSEFHDAAGDDTASADDDDPFLKEYLDEEEDDELDDIDPKYRKPEQTKPSEPADTAVAEPGAVPEVARPEPAGTAKKA